RPRRPSAGRAWPVCIGDRCGQPGADGHLTPIDRALRTLTGAETSVRAQDERGEPPMRYLPLENRQTRECGELWTSRWPDGTPREQGRLLHGRRLGVWIRWYEHGRRAEESPYADGRLHGPATAWFPTG